MSDMTKMLKEAPIVEIAVALNMIVDIVDRIKTQTGIEITPENIGQYIEDRKAIRQELNATMGITSEESAAE